MMHSETGGLNFLMRIWPHVNFADRARVCAEKITLDRRPPEIGEFLIGQKIKLPVPTACTPIRP